MSGQRMTKKEPVSVEVCKEVCSILLYRLSCGDAVRWADAMPPAYCPFCGRPIDYSRSEVSR